jgi:uracil-DNA glycosylase family 4
LNDGLKLKSTFITNILKCVPPNDKPLKIEINKCSNYFNSELEILKNLKVIVTLGKVAFDNCIKYYKQTYKIKKKFTFKHGKRYNLPDGMYIDTLISPEPQKCKY